MAKNYWSIEISKLARHILHLQMDVLIANYHAMRFDTANHLVNQPNFIAFRALLNLIENNLSINPFLHSERSSFVLDGERVRFAETVGWRVTIIVDHVFNPNKKVKIYHIHHIDDYAVVTFAETLSAYEHDRNQFGSYC